MRIESMAEEMVSELCETANAERVKFTKKMAPTSMKIIGVTNPAFKNLLKRWSPGLKKLPDSEWISLAQSLVDTCIFEANQMAFEILWKNKAALRLLTREHIELLGKNIDNWATVDALGVMIAGWAWRENRLADDDILRWLSSENRWWRRLALVATIPLNMKSRGGSGDTSRTLMVCEKVIDDRDDMIVKALSWALRELSKTDKEAVSVFILKNEKRLASRVLREVNSKLRSGKKNG